MNIFQPKILKTLKTYTKEQFLKDVIAGIIVAVIALPLSIALALASGVRPEQGLYTAIIAGFVIAMLGGSRVNISGPTAAFATIVAGIVATKGLDGLIIATIMAGIILIIMGLLRFGSLIRFIPYTITTGFTAGIAVTIVIGQVKDFCGMSFTTRPIETKEKVEAIISNLSTFHLQAFLLGVLCVLIQVFWPKVTKKVPGSLIAILVSIAVVKVFHLEVNTIGSLYEISNKLPVFHFPGIDFKNVSDLLPDAFTIAMLAGIESLLSCVVSDGMINGRHNPNTELIAQGAGNLLSGLFGGIPATGAIARTTANVKNGGRTPVAGMVHAVVLCLILVLLMPYASMIPMPAIAAILFVVAYHMSEWRHFVDLIRTAPKSDILILLVTFILTVVFDLVIAIEIGIILAALTFMKRMADTTQVTGWKYLADEKENQEDLMLKAVPDNTLVYEIDGPMFFGAAEKFVNIPMDKSINTIIFRMRGVPAMDATGLRSLEKVKSKCEKNEINLLLSHVREQPMAAMRKAGFDKKIGEENFCENIDAALSRARSLALESGGNTVNNA